MREVSAIEKSAIFYRRYFSQELEVSNKKVSGYNKLVMRHEAWQ